MKCYFLVADVVAGTNGFQEIALKGRVSARSAKVQLGTDLKNEPSKRDNEI